MSKWLQSTGSVRRCPFAWAHPSIYPSAGNLANHISTEARNLIIHIAVLWLVRAAAAAPLHYEQVMQHFDLITVLYN